MAPGVPQFPSLLVTRTPQTLPSALTATVSPPSARGLAQRPPLRLPRTACALTVTPVSSVHTAQSCEERNLRENGYECEWRYNSCAPACPTTCQHPEPLACPVQCVEGCHAHCPPGQPPAPGGGGLQGWDRLPGKAVPCPMSSQPGPVVPRPRLYNPGFCFPGSFHQSLAS